MNVWVGLGIITVAEATIGIFVQLVGDSVPVMLINFYRMLFATVFLAAVLPFTIDKTFWHFPKGNVKDTFIIGLLITAQISVFNYALTLVPIANAVIFWSVSPFFAFIFSWVFIKEKVTKEHVFIFLIAMIGILVAEPVSEGNTFGNLVALGSGAVYAALVTYMRHEGKTEEHSDIFWSFVFGTAVLVPALFFFDSGSLLAPGAQTLFGLSAPAIVWIIALGTLSTGLAYLLINTIIKKLNAGTYSLFDTIVSPIIAAVFALLVFIQIPSMNMIYGGALLLISGYWLTRRMRHGDPVPAKKY